MSRGHRRALGRARCRHFRFHVVDRGDRLIWRRRLVFSRVHIHRQIHVVGEFGLVGATATDPHATAFTTGYGRAIGQRHRRVVAIPTDHQGIGGGSLLKAPSRQGGFLVAGVEPISENRPGRRRIRYPRSQLRAVGPGGRIATGNIRSADDLIDKRQLQEQSWTRTLPTISIGNQFLWCLSRIIQIMARPTRTADMSRNNIKIDTEGFSANVTNQHKSRYRAKSGNEHGRTCATRHRVDYSQQR